MLCAPLKMGNGRSDLLAIIIHEFIANVQRGR